MSEPDDSTGRSSAAGRRRLLADLLERQRSESPLSFAQQRIWFLQQLAPDVPTFNVPAVVRVGGALDVGVLRTALELLVERHEQLRTVFFDTPNGPRQRLDPSIPLDFSVRKAQGGSAPEREADALRQANAEARRIFDLTKDPPMRVMLLEIGESDHLLSFTFHHIAAEVWSISILFRELDELYSAPRLSREAVLPALDLRYTDFVRWQRKRMAEGAFREDLEACSNLLGADVPALDLPTDRPRRPVQSQEGRWRSRLLPASLARAAGAFSQAHDGTLYMTLLSAFGVLLHRCTQRDDIVVGSPVAGRDRPQIENLVGMFVNTLVLKLDLSGDATFAEVFERTRRTCLSAYAHQGAPFEKIVENLSPDRDASVTPLFQVMFSLASGPAPTLTLGSAKPGVVSTPADVHTGTTKVDLSLIVEATPQGLLAGIEYSTDLFEEASIDDMLARFEVLLTAALEDPERRLSALPVITAADRRRILSASNVAAVPYPLDRSVGELFAEQAARTPEAVAVCASDAEFSYGDIARRAVTLAGRLARYNVTEGEPVAIFLRRGPEFIVAVLAVWKAGGAYLPLDTESPKERLQFMLSDSEARVVLTSRALSSSLSGCKGARLLVDEEFTEQEPPAPPRRTNLSAVAYCIYTSGSTGKPKAVEVEHRSLLNLIWWHRHAYGVGPSSRASFLSSLAFDASVWEVWPYLTAGASLETLEEISYLSPAELVQWLAERSVTHCFLPTPLAELVLQEKFPENVETPALRWMLTGGDVLRTSPPPVTPFRFVNHYGPTENTVVATSAEIPPTLEAEIPPIGRPIANVRTYVLDAGMRLVPIGVPGELYIGGASLARGYLRRPELTASKFVADPFSDDPSSRLYATGDRVRLRRDGDLEFLGRLDSQVKIRGRRIELGEIESALNRSSEILQCCVTARDHERLGRSLVAYVVPRGPQLNQDQLRDFLGQTLPDYMLPTHYVGLDALPLTSNGKVDLRALPQPTPESGAPSEPPSPGVATEITSIWRETLERSEFSSNDNFFDVGGHSLLLTQIHKQLQDRFAVRFPLVKLFQHPSVSTQSELIETLTSRQ